MTAYDSFSYVQTALRLEAVDYLLKPFHDGDLEKAVQRVQAKLAPKKTVLPEPKTGSGNRYVSEAIQYIKNHYQEPDISVSSVAQSLNISEGHLSHTFRKETGSTLLGYLTRYRIHKAAELLKDCRVKVYEVAEQVGYRDIGYFPTPSRKSPGKHPRSIRTVFHFVFRRKRHVLHSGCRYARQRQEHHRRQDFGVSGNSNAVQGLHQGGAV